MNIDDIIKAFTPANNDSFNEQRLAAIERMLLVTLLTEALNSKGLTHLAEKKWVLPQAGDVVRCVNLNPAIADSLKVGKQYKILSISACDKLGLPAFDQQEYEKLGCAMYSSPRMTIGFIVIGIEEGMTKEMVCFIHPIDCFEPV